MPSLSKLLILLLLLFPSDCLFADGISDYLRKGDEYFRAFDNQRALTEYQKAYSQNPRYAETLQRMVRVYNDLGRIALRRDSTSEQLYLKAVAYAESLLVHHPRNAASHFWVALAKGSLIPFRSTREKIRIGKDVRLHAQQALALDSTFSMTYVVLAIFEREGARLKWYEKAIVRVVFGTDLSGTLLQSEQYLLTALKYDPKNSFALYELSSTYRALENKQKAIGALEQMIRLAPQNARERQLQEEAKRRLERLRST
ncbi:MAG: hypothetical protein V1799_14055 [bacterium]